VAYEWLHPPVSKLLMAGSIKIFGDNSFAWRFPGTIFGVLTVWAIYFWCKSIFKSTKLGVLAAFLASLDGLLLTQSRIAMNDIYLTFFVVMAVAFFWKYQNSIQESVFRSQGKKDLRAKKGAGLMISSHQYLLATGVFAGLAMASKWSGFFLWLIFGGWELFQIGQNWLSGRYKKRQILIFAGSLVIAGMAMWVSKGISLESGKISSTIPIPLLFWVLAYLVFLSSKMIEPKRLIKMTLAWFVLPLAIYVGSYAQFWLQGHTLDQFRELNHQIIWYQTHLEATHAYQSRPNQWVLDLKPVWFYVSYNGDKIGNIYALSNPAVSWFGLIGIIACFFAGVLTKKKSLLFLCLCYLLVWFPWVWSPRIMFYYHYTPAIPFLSIALAWLISKLDKSGGAGKAVGGAMILVTVLLFVYFYPHWTGIELPKSFVDHYYWFKSWK
jgi:dolichyl-phosphate-mannose--protein O-mannosyl transferase